MNIDKLADTLTKEIEAHNFAKSVYLAYEAEWAATHPEESRTLDTEDTTEVAADAATQAPDTAEEGAGV
jgi:hypothetical protein